MLWTYAFIYSFPYGRQDGTLARWGTGVGAGFRYVGNVCQYRLYDQLCSGCKLQDHGESTAVIDDKMYLDTCGSCAVFTLHSRLQAIPELLLQCCSLGGARG